MTFLSQQLQGARAFWASDLRRYVRHTAGFILLSFLMGVILWGISPEKSAEAIEDFFNYAAGAGVMDEEGQLSLLGILNNNWTAMLVSVGYGIIPVIQLPIVTLFINGAFLGVMMSYSMSRGLSLAAVIMGILPHGIFEISALIISSALGLYLCRFVTAKLLRHGDALHWTAMLEHILQVLLLIVFPLTCIAAIVETYFTTWLLGFFI